MIKRLSLLAVLVVFPVLADSVDDAIAKVQDQLTEARTHLTRQREKTAKERDMLQNRLTTLTRETHTVKAEELALTKRMDDLANEEAESQSRHYTLVAQLKRSSQLLVEGRKDLQSPVQNVSPTRDSFTAVDALLAQNEPLPSAICDALLPIVQTHLREGETVSLSDSPVLKPDGTKISAKVYRLGGIASYALEEGRAGILEPNAIEHCYSLHPTLLPGAMTKAVHRSATEKSGVVHLPIDVAGGRGLSRLESHKDLIAFLKAGGPVVIPLLLIALIAIVMVVERFFYLLRVDKNVDQMLTRVLPYLEKADYDGAMETVGSSRGPVSNIIQNAVEHGRRNADKLEELLQEAILSELPTLERFLGALAVMAAAAPLLGLLGTVSGMIGTFEIISSYGTGNAKLMSGGISEALITTEIGLIVAVPILLAHAWLNRQIRTIVGHMDRAAISLASTIRQKKGGSDT